MTRRIQCFAETPWAGCKRAEVIEVADDATEEQIEQEAREWFFNDFNYSWHDLADDEEGPRRMNRWPKRLAAPVYAGDTTAASWWQSRHRLARPPQLTDLRELARAIWRNAPCPA